MKRKLNDELISLRMPIAMKQDLEQIAINNECSISSVVRYAVSNLVKDEQVYNSKQSRTLERMERFGATKKYMETH